MEKRLQNAFVFSAAVILFIAAAAKLLSVTSAAQALNAEDGLLSLPHRHVFVLTGGLELAVSAYLLLGLNSKTKLALIAWVAANFLVYRIGLWWSGAPNLCNCFGLLHDYLPISPPLLNAVALTALGWLLLGSGAFLLLGWRRGAQVPSGPVLRLDEVPS